MNIGGSTKDRVALMILEEAEKRGQVKPGCTVFEGTVGSTGISLAIICKAKGYNCHIIMPDDVAPEKAEMLLKLGATVEKVPAAPIVDDLHFVNLARKRAAHLNRDGGCGFFCDQFENPDNFKAHFEGTGPEIYRQTGGDIDAIVMGAGTGGMF